MSEKKLILDEVHKKASAKMVSYAGYSMPISYTSLVEEHLCVRNRVGIFDVSHMGQFVFQGKNAYDLLQYVISNDIERLKDGQALYGYLPNDNGGIVDDTIVYRFTEDKYMIVPNAANIDKDWNWIQEKNTWNVQMRNLTDRYCLFAVQGPMAVDLLQLMTDLDLGSIKNYHFEIGEIAGCENVIISATGYTGAGGFELYVDNSQAVKLWNNIIEKGQIFDIKPIGLGARDSLRLEMGYCLYGNDINDETSPIAANLGWTTKFNKDFVAKDIIENQKSNGTETKLVGLLLTGRGIPRQGYTILNQEEHAIGHITSGTMSPVLNKGIGLGFVKRAYAKKDTELLVKIRKNTVPAKVVRPPFI